MEINHAEDIRGSFHVPLCSQLTAWRVPGEVTAASTSWLGKRRLWLQRGSSVADTSQRQLCSWELHSFCPPACCPQGASHRAGGAPNATSLAVQSTQRWWGVMMGCDVIHIRQLHPSIWKSQGGQWEERRHHLLPMSLAELEEGLLRAAAAAAARLCHHHRASGAYRSALCQPGPCFPRSLSSLLERGNFSLPTGLQLQVPGCSSAPLQAPARLLPQQLTLIGP